MTEQRPRKIGSFGVNYPTLHPAPGVYRKSTIQATTELLMLFALKVISSKLEAYRVLMYKYKVLQNLMMTGKDGCGLAILHSNSQFKRRIHKLG
jgi:hypothetical protein